MNRLFASVALLLALSCRRGSSKELILDRVRPLFPSAEDCHVYSPDSVNAQRRELNAKIATRLATLPRGAHLAVIDADVGKENLCYRVRTADGRTLFIEADRTLLAE